MRNSTSSTRSIDPRTTGPWPGPAAGGILGRRRQGRGAGDARNPKTGARRLGPGIPKSDFWAKAKEGTDQVGCVYTAQGFEFDHVSVIFGPDLIYRPMDGGWIVQRHEPRDRIVSLGVTDVEFTAFIKSTYRALLASKVTMTIRAFAAREVGELLDPAG